MSDPAGELTNDPISAAEAPAEAPPAPKPKQPRDEHGHFVTTKGSGKAAGKGSSPRAAGEEADLEELRAMLREQVREMAPLLVLPTAAEVWHDKAEAAVENLITLARRYPVLRHGLETGVVVFAALGLANFASAVGYGAACDLGFADPYSAAGRMMGIDAAYDRAHPEEEVLDGGPAAAGDNGQTAPTGTGSPRRRRRAVPSILGGVQPEPT